MLWTYLTGVVGVAGAMVLWAVVQQLWGRLFFPTAPRVDALEKRGGCGQCGCTTRCVTAEPRPEMRGRLSASENDDMYRHV